MKPITINILNDKYTIDTRSFHRIGDLKKTIGLWLDILPNKFVVENEYSLPDDKGIWEAVYRPNENMLLMDRCILIESLKTLKPKQFRIRSLNKYSIITVDENLNLKQFIDVIMFLFKANYLSMGCNILIGDEEGKVSNLRKGAEIICHYCLNGGNRKGFGTESSDDEFEEEEQNENAEEEEEWETVEEKEPEEIEHFDPFIRDYILKPDD
jgi:hypothetical protein